MNFLCETNEINSVLSSVVKILASKAAIPALDGIYIEAKNDCCKIIGGNGQLTIETSFKADVKESGYVLVPGKIFANIIRQCKGNDIEISSDTSLTISSDKARMTIALMEPDSYPMVELKGDLWEFEMEVPDFKDAVRGSIFCAAGENYSKPVFTGVLIEKLADVIKFITIDGFRMAVKNSTAKGSDGKLLIPAKALDEISKSLPESGTIKFSVYKNYVKAEFDDISIISTLMNADEYINYNDILPKNYKTKIKIERSKLLNAIGMASVVSRAKQNNLLVLDINDSVFTITAKSDIGDSYEELDILHEGDHIKIGFNGGFLSDSLRGTNDEFIFIEFDSPRSPCLIKPCEGNDFIYMILPIQI